MEWDLINTDVLQLTVIPAALVLVALVLWFRRSDPKGQSRSRERPRPRFSAADLDEDALSDQPPRMRAEEFDISPARVISSEDTVAKVHEKSPRGEHAVLAPQDSPKPMFGAGFARTRTPVAPPPDTHDRRAKRKINERSSSEDDRYEEDTTPKSKRIVTPLTPVRIEHEVEEVDEARAATPEDPQPTDESSTSEITNKDGNPTANKVERELENGLMLALTVVAQGRQLRGSQVLKAVTASGLSYGKMGIFHYFSPTRPGPRALFSVANVVEPGTFNLAQMEEVSTPGMILFANVTRPEDAMSTFNVMLEKARQLAAALDANVCDGRRSTLSKQGIEHIYSEIGEFQRRSRLVQAAHA